MLVLTRKCGERITIETENEIIEVRVLNCDGGKVRIGVQASKDVRIVRTELLGNEREG